MLLGIESLLFPFSSLQEFLAPAVSVAEVKPPFVVAISESPAQLALAAAIAAARYPAPPRAFPAQPCI